MQNEKRAVNCGTAIRRGVEIQRPFLSFSIFHLPFIVLALLAGCESYQDKTAALRAAWSAGNYLQAADIAEKQAMKARGTADDVLWSLEAGATTRTAGNLTDSFAAFNHADGLFDYWDNQPEVSVSAEAGALLVNQTVLTYRGTDYDRIMESTYQGLNYLQEGKFDEARVELRRALERQREALAANTKRIEDAQKAAAESAKSKDGYDVQRAEDDPRFHAGYERAYGSLDALHFYAPYVNPFTTYLQGLTLLTRPQGVSDLESARVDLQRVREMIGSNPYIDADCDLVQKLQAGGEMPEVTYVIYETGIGPMREEERLDIPLFVVSRSVPYVGVALPKLAYNSQFNPGLTIRTTVGAPLKTTLLCDMDLVVAQEFKNELPVIVTKTLLSAGIKAGAQYGLYRATKGNDTMNILTEIGGVIYQYATNRADLRTWVTLPKQFVFCRLPTPTDHKLDLVSDSTGETRTVDLPAGRTILVYVKSTSFADRLVVNTFPLQ